MFVACGIWCDSQSLGDNRRVDPLRYCGVAVRTPAEHLKDRREIRVGTVLIYGVVGIAILNRCVWGFTLL